MRSEIRSLTGLRGLAACWVMVGHYMGELPMSPLLHTLISHMYVAVDLFMILSGFVLAMTYEARFAAPFSASVYAQFLQHRLARLWPLYALVTLGCLLLMEAGIGDNCSTRTPLAIALNFLMMQAWWWPDDSISGTGWTLSIEWGVNLLFPLFVMLLLHASKPRAMLVMAAALVVLITDALLQGQTAYAKPMPGGINWYYAPDSLIRCTVEFMLGIYLWRLRVRAEAMRFLGRDATQALLLGLMAICTAFPALDLLFVGLAGALVVGCSYQESRLSGWFGAALPRWLGAISFSVYLLHLMVLPLRAVVEGWWTGIAPVDFFFISSPTEAMMCIAIVLGLSTLSYRGIERPMQRWLRGLDPARIAIRWRSPPVCRPSDPG